jgi:hypothetical protein
MFFIRMKITFLFIIAFISQVRAQTPGVRNGHAMVYDGDLHADILFGGADAAKVCSDTWSYTKGRWKKIPEQGPGPRTFPAMVMADHYILLFGGNRVLFGDEMHPAHYLDDTWLFRNGHWKKLDLAIHPGPRAEMAIGYDPVHKKVLLFGGRQAGDQWILSDTWEFDGNLWTQLYRPGPSARSGAVMNYDMGLKQLVLFGGNPVIAKDQNYNGPMWSWDGVDWHRMAVSDSLVFNSTMVFDAADNYLIRFGGWNGKERLNNTWIFQNGFWIKLEPATRPEARNHATMVFDNDQGACLLFGGHDGENVFGDLWSFKKGNWFLIHEEKPRKRKENGH